MLGLIDAEHETGVPYLQIAQEIGLTSDWSLTTGWRVGQGRWPRRNVVLQLAKRYGVSPSKIYTPREEVEPQGDPGLVTRALLFALGLSQDDVDQLTDRQVERIQEAALALAQGMLGK